jgi:hypothetical protein
VLKGVSESGRAVSVIRHSEVILALRGRMSYWRQRRCDLPNAVFWTNFRFADQSDTIAHGSYFSTCRLGNPDSANAISTTIGGAVD